MPLVRRTRQTLRSAEFCFFGVVVYTRVHTPRRWGLPFSAGTSDFSTSWVRPRRISWLVVAMWQCSPVMNKKPSKKGHFFEGADFRDEKASRQHRAEGWLFA